MPVVDRFDAVGDNPKQRLLQRAVKLTGQAELARLLKIPEALLDAWIQGLATMPDGKLLPLSDVLAKIGHDASPR